MSTPTSPNTPEFNQQLLDISCRLAKWFAEFQLHPNNPDRSAVIALGHEMLDLLQTNNVDFSNS